MDIIKKQRKDSNGLLKESESFCSVKIFVKNMETFIKEEKNEKKKYRCKQFKDFSEADKKAS